MTMKFDEEYMRAVCEDARRKALATIIEFFEKPTPSSLDPSKFEETLTALNYLRAELANWMDPL
jgi:hypothetical protein